MQKTDIADTHGLLRLLLCLVIASFLGYLILPLGAVAQTVVNKELFDYAGPADRAIAGVFEDREKDWRNGAIVYQVLVDRFVPPASLHAKRTLYPAPKVLHPWSETAKRGKYLESMHVWSHEIDFWGGDLPGVTSKLTYIHELGADVLYLNPVHLGYTNHKYDALDFLKIPRSSVPRQI